MFFQESEEFEEIPGDAPLVDRVWSEFVASRTALDKSALRDRDWKVLPFVEGVLADFGEWFLDALRERGIERLLAVATHTNDAGAPSWAGWVPVSFEGRICLQDAASVDTFVAVDPDLSFCWLQAWTDAYLLAGDAEFIADLHGCSFETIFDISLENAGAFDEEPWAEWGLEMCQDYQEFLPEGLTCDVPTLQEDHFRRRLERVEAEPSPVPNAALETRKGVRVLSSSFLNERDWLVLPVRIPFDRRYLDEPDVGWVLSAAAEAERLAAAIARLGHDEVLGYLLAEDEASEVVNVGATRDDILGAIDLSWDQDILLTSSSRDFLALGSAGEFFLVAGPVEFVRTAAGGDIHRYLQYFDIELSRIATRAPEVANVLTDSLLEYFDALDFDSRRQLLGDG